MSEQGEIISPKNLTAYKTVRLGRWAIPITAETMRKIKIAGAIALFAPASWLLAEFFQLRGFVNLTASRIMLFFLWVFFALACWLILSQLIRRKLFVVILSGLLPFAAVIGLDRWAQAPPQSGNALLSGTTGANSPTMPTAAEIAAEVAKKIPRQHDVQALPSEQLTTADKVRAEVSKAFNVTDGTLGIVNLNQSLEDNGSSVVWVTYPWIRDNAASPLALLSYMEITNLTSMPQTIKTYQLEIETKDCGWNALIPIPMRGVNVWYLLNGLEKAIQLDFKNNGLDYKLQSPIPAGGTVNGWWIFDSKKKCDDSKGSKYRQRITLATFSGIKFQHTSAFDIFGKPQRPFPSEGVTSGPTFQLVPHSETDISKFRRRLWSSTDVNN